MIETEINIAIAEKRGWTDIGTLEINGEESVNGCLPDNKDAWIPIPNYCHDLNAMQEAIFSLSQEDRVKWFNNLCEIVDMKKKLNLDAMSIFYLINSTARERAKAFLITKGKWKE